MYVKYPTHLKRVPELLCSWVSSCISVFSLNCFLRQRYLLRSVASTWTPPPVRSWTHKVWRRETINYLYIVSRASLSPQRLARETNLYTHIMFRGVNVALQYDRVWTRLVCMPGLYQPPKSISLKICPVKRYSREQN